MLTQCIQMLAEALSSLARHTCLAGAPGGAPAAPGTGAAPPGRDVAAEASLAERRAVVASLEDAVYALNNMLTVVAGNAELGLLAADHEGSLAALKAIQQAAAGGVVTVQGLGDLAARLRVVDSGGSPLEG